jgi:hypothetical protein
VYRFYQVDKAGQIQGPPKVISCEDDDVALLQARQLVDGYAIEIWDGDRKVAFIPADEE